MTLLERLQFLKWLAWEIIKKGYRKVIGSAKL